MSTLAVATIAKNEETYLPKALASARLVADEIVVVVDNQSTDRTADVAREFTDRVFVEPARELGSMKNRALDRALSDWVFFLDADEEVTPQLANEIKKVLQQPPGQLRRHPEAEGRRISTPDDKILRGVYPRAKRRAQDDKINCYFVRIITHFLGKPLRHLWGTNPRLLRRGAAHWDNRKVHEQVARSDGTTVTLKDSDVGFLEQPLNHPSHYTTLRAYLEKRALYTRHDAEELLGTGRDRLGRPINDPLHSAWSLASFLLLSPTKRFIRLFLKKRGFLDSWQGWLWCWLSAEYEYMVARKYLALRHTQERAGRSVQRAETPRHEEPAR